ncbi:M20/M25/M40 family metallo-hydrolase [Halobaculum sp. MBLA0147]|uniref:M20/M25/M40 family metallo-hydrolase n=1 Tax=Halobaculum sp. MBLA0147 TaxID=3079934 RepID=UPI003523CE90
MTETDVDGVVADRLDDYREALFDLLARPTISTRGEGMDAGADAVVDFCERFGFDARRIETSRYPLVYAERPATAATGGDEGAAERPTVVCYGHYDVQPADDPAAWETPAFEPTVRDGAIYARGAGDNKGQFTCHAFAVDALSRADALPEVDVRLLIEGGEESGSVGLREYLDDDAGTGETAGAPTEIADADLVYVADGPQHRSGRPTLLYGNRGIVTFELHHETAATDLHSGNFGGPVPNAATELVELLGTMVADGRPTIDGFHEGIAVGDAERELIEQIPVDEAALREELGVSRFVGDTGYYERLLAEPTFTVNGLEAGYQGEGSKTVIPRAATAKCDCRLVPGQEPERVFEAIEAHVDAHRPEVTVERGTAFPPMQTPVDTPLATPVVDALRAVWGEEPVELPVMGGSLPAAFFRTADALAETPLLVVPYANHDQGNHSPNEHLDLACFENGIRTTAAVLRRVAAADADDDRGVA